MLAVVLTMAVLVPVLGAANFGYQAAVSVAKDRAKVYAQAVLFRADETADEVTEASNRLVALSPGRPCGPEQLALMRALDIGSAYLQAVGYVEDDRLKCASVDTGADLGPVEVVSPSGAVVRAPVRLPPASDSDLLVVESDAHYAALVDKTLVLDVASSRTGIERAVVALPSRKVLMASGASDPGWSRHVPLERNRSRAFLDNGRAGAVVTSRTHHIAAMAVLPRGDLAALVGRYERWVLPIGLLAAVVLVGGVLLLDRLRVTAGAQLRSGLRREEFFVEYQPIVDLAGGTVVGLEALLRWRRQDGSLTRPEVFIAAAEDSGVIQQLTARLCELVAADAQQLLTACPGGYVALNLSAADLHDPSLATRLQALAHLLQADQGRLVVEITERALVEPALAAPVVAALRSSGIAVAIDDFGTGYSSLSSLRSFELDYLKIDKSFVDSLGKDAPTSHVVSHIIALANALHLGLIAEGVERPEQAELLRARGVGSAQGWLFSAAVPADRVVEAVNKVGSTTS
jgi:sensor c-di-GMP phosphodiesterase-like protein